MCMVSLRSVTFALLLCGLSLSVLSKSELEQASVKAASQQRYEVCVLRLVEESIDMRAQTIKDRCRAQESALGLSANESPIEERMEDEEATIMDRFVLTPHKPNYILPISYNSNPVVA